MTVYDTIREGIADDFRKARRYDALVAEVAMLREALTSIAITAQQASVHEPAQFCEWAYTCASGALNRND